MHYLYFSLWLTSLCMIIFASIHIPAKCRISFLFMANISFIYVPYFFIHSSVNGHLGCFYILVVLNSAAMNIMVHASFGITVFWGYISRSWFDRTYGNCNFSFLRNLHTVLYSWCITFHPSTNVRQFNFLHTLPSIYCLYIYIYIFFIWSLWLVWGGNSL